MAYNQSIPKTFISSDNVSPPANTSILTSNSIGVTNYSDLDASGVGSDWVVFAPHSDEEEDISERSDVLSTSNEYELDEALQAAPRDIEDDDDSLIDSLDTTDLKFSLPTHDGSGNFALISNHFQQESEEDTDEGLTNGDFITTRIDKWNQEQEQIFNSNKEGVSKTPISSRESEILASWGVDDRKLSDTTVDISHPLKSSLENEHNLQEVEKRFYGDSVFSGYTEWEVGMIKRVAKQLSSSLVCDHEKPQNRSSKNAVNRRRSLLFNLSNSANQFFAGNAVETFWKKDLNSAHSSISTNSLMLSHLSWNDVA